MSNNLIKKSILNSKTNLETLYTNINLNTVIDAIELPNHWHNFSIDELKNEARNAILQLSRSSNSNFKAKELGFKNAEHLIEICFNYLLK